MTTQTTTAKVDNARRFYVRFYGWQNERLAYVNGQTVVLQATLGCSSCNKCQRHEQVLTDNLTAKEVAFQNVDLGDSCHWIEFKIPTGTDVVKEIAEATGLSIPCFSELSTTFAEEERKWQNRRRIRMAIIVIAIVAAGSLATLWCWWARSILDRRILTAFMAIAAGTGLAMCMRLPFSEEKMHRVKYWLSGVGIMSGIIFFWGTVGKLYPVIMPPDDPQGSLQYAWCTVHILGSIASGLLTLGAMMFTAVTFFTSSFSPDHEVRYDMF